MHIPQSQTTMRSHAVTAPRLAGAVILLLLPAGCAKPSGPWTSSDLPSLTNAVQGLGKDPIVRIDRVDADRRVAVYTGTNEHCYFFEWTRGEWKNLQPVIARP